MGQNFNIVVHGNDTQIGQPTSIRVDTPQWAVVDDNGNQSPDRALSKTGEGAFFLTELGKEKSNELDLGLLKAADHTRREKISVVTSRATEIIASAQGKLTELLSGQHKQEFETVETGNQKKIFKVSDQDGETTITCFSHQAPRVKVESTSDTNQQKLDMTTSVTFMSTDSLTTETLRASIDTFCSQ